MAYNIADLFEHTVDAVPDRIALVDRDTVLTFAELDALGQPDRPLPGGPGRRARTITSASTPRTRHEWIETMSGAFKIRAIPININFRYVEDELAYLIGNAELVACVFDREYAGRLAAVMDRSPKLKTLSTSTTAPAATWRVSDRRTSTRHAPASRPSATSPSAPRDDLYVLYTGGTTGMPKGVMWRQEDMFFALGQGIDAVTGERVTDEFHKAERPPRARRRSCSSSSRRSCTAPRRWERWARCSRATRSCCCPSSPARRVGRGQRARRQRRAHHRRRHGPPDDRALDEDPDRWDTSVAHLGVVVGRDVLAVGEGPVPRATSRT